MSLSPEIAELLRRFVDDRDALQEHEYAQLVEAVKASPELAAQIRDQLTIDDVLSQCLAIDRRQFDAQVQQRIADHLCGEDELDQQADELRSLALARLEGGPRESGTSWSSVIAWSTALLVLLTVGIGLWQWRRSQRDALLATVDEIAGQVLVQRYPRGSDEYAQAGTTLQLGDRLSLAEDASIALSWSDGTRVQLGGGTQISLPETTAGKRVALDLGNLTASVARQPAAQPMIFATPHAEAIVRGTELYLRVQASDTHLEVVEGKVELVERQTQDSQLVESSESATATPGVKVAKSSILWPTSQQGLVYLFAAGRRPLMLRSGSLRQPGLWEPQDSATVNAAFELELSGGWFEDRTAADVATQIEATHAMSLEIVFASASPPDDQSRTVIALVGNQKICSLMEAGRQLQFQVAGGPVLELGSLPEFGKLSHLAITCQDHELTAYLDGQLLRKVAFQESIGGDASRLVVGGVDPTARWQGRVAGLAIYDRALQEAEISRNLPSLRTE